jgi:Flp pilus assembly pilin Flp
MKSLFVRFVKDESGATAIEYGLNSAVTKSVLDQSVSGTTTMRSAAISPSTSGIIAMTNAASV